MQAKRSATPLCLAEEGRVRRTKAPSPLRPAGALQKLACLGLAFLLAGALSARAQWLTESFNLQSGWNAVYLHVDASHDTIENQVGADLTNPILEIWLWAPPSSTMQFVQSPQEPVDAGSQWRSWVRNSIEPQTLQRLAGYAACLVRVAASAPTYTWSL
ncbi:MAG: hypothetical protein HY674_09620 [Chloroflexi bacterium]|nr:hypothetical protein [Chloroflexota bacterium]